MKSSDGRMLVGPPGSTCPASVDPVSSYIPAQRVVAKRSDLVWGHLGGDMETDEI